MRSLNLEKVGKQVRKSHFMRCARAVTWIVLSTSLFASLAPLTCAAAKSRRCWESAWCCTERNVGSAAHLPYANDGCPLNLGPQDCQDAQVCSADACVPAITAGAAYACPQGFAIDLDQTTIPDWFIFELIKPPTRLS